MQRALLTITDHLQKRMAQNPCGSQFSMVRYMKQAEILSTMLQEKLNVAKIEILRISPVLGVHTGPGIVGAAVVPSELMDDLV